MPEQEKQFEFGVGMETGNENDLIIASQRGHLVYPLGPADKIAIREVLRELIVSITRRDIFTIPSGATTFEATADFMSITGAAAVTIATITGGYDGQILSLLFTDANVTITDDATTTRNTVNLSAAFASTANDVLTLRYNGNKWFEMARSTN
jgi:hypothetical protein